MRVRALASGSSGNCYLIQAGGHSLLVDCGLPPTTLQKFLLNEGVNIAELDGIFLTHDHYDHLRGAGAVSLKWGVPVYGNKRTLEAAFHAWEKTARLEELRGGRVPATRVYNTKILATGKVASFGPLEISSFPVSHDAADTVCYTFRADGTQAVILTDLGCATQEIFEPLAKSDLIVLEANHALDNLLQNPNYPYSLKRRISGDRGHLSNEQSAQILRRCIEESGPEHTVWLAHLSKENNHPTTAIENITKVLEEAGINNFPLEVATRDKPSLAFEAGVSYQQARMF